MVLTLQTDTQKITTKYLEDEVSLRIINRYKFCID